MITLFGFDKFDCPFSPVSTCPDPLDQCNAACTRLIVLQVTLHHPPSISGTPTWEIKTWYKKEDTLTKLMEEKTGIPNPSLVTSTTVTHTYWQTPYILQRRVKKGELGPLLFYLNLDNQLTKNVGYLEILLH